MLTEIQKIILTCCLGTPEDKTAFSKFKKAAREKARREEDPSIALRARELDAARRLSNPEKYREADRLKSEKHRNLHPGAQAESTRRYKENHPDEVRISYQKSRKKSYHRDPNFKLAVTLRNALGRALRQSKTKKGRGTFELLGCPISQFKTHLESLFKPGMVWENHGPVWHIDHIRPIANFNLTDPEQQKICFHWTNFQPLFAADNIRKSDTYHV